MDNNEEKKPKRPRIGENRIAASSDGENNFSSKVDHGQQGDYHSPENGHREYNSYDRPQAATTTATTIKAVISLVNISLSRV